MSAASDTGPQDAPPPTVALLLGDVALLVRRAEEALLARVFEGRSPGFNLSVFSAEDGGWGALDQAKTTPMMARRRAVVLRGMDKASADLLDALLAYVEKPNPTTTLVLVGEKLPAASGGVDRGRRLENRIKASGEVSRFRSQDQDPTAAAIRFASEAGCTLDRRAASLLVELVGADLGRLQMEVAKAASFVGGSGPIPEAVVEEVSSVVAEAVIWDLTDALLTRNADRGLAAAHRLLEDGEASHRLLAMVSWQMRQLLEVQDWMSHGGPEPSAWARMPSFKKNAARQALSRHPLNAARILSELVGANREMNRSPAGDRRIFEGLILKLTAG